MNHYTAVQYPEAPVQSAPISRGRKVSSTGGNRSWSEEEEAYLLQTRMQKMPYKHIAAHLKKTELACRLHYHQLSHGSHRRKRAGSMCSSGSSSSTGASSRCCHSPCDDENCSGHASRHSSPAYTHNLNNASPGRAQHKILLPKPGPVMAPHDPMKGLRINTSDSMIHGNNNLDTDRLRAIYESRRASFWSAVASDYGADVSPAQLEEIFRQGGNVQGPLTPDQSPIDGRTNPFNQYKPAPFPAYPSQSAIERAKGYSPVNPASAVSSSDRMPYMLPPPTPSSSGLSPISRMSRNNNWGPSGSGVSVASLLTEDRPPRPEYISHRSYDDVHMRDRYH